jgi:hypothetical protein
MGREANMEWTTYSCPKCGAVLNPSGVVTLIASRTGIRVLFGFHPEPGNYRVFLPPDVDAADGAEWDFSCPVCWASLACADHRKLAEIAQIVGVERRRLLFSRIAGERATYVLSGDDGRVESHGEHADRYDDTVRLTPHRRGEGAQ